jgi:hypothetical protein
MINRRDELIQCEMYVWNGEVSQCTRCQGFETACEIVAEKSDGPPEEWGEVRGAFNPRKPEGLPETCERVL